MTNGKKQEVVKKAGFGAVDAIPDFMKESQPGQGTEGLSQNAMSPPRLKLLQALSPELEEDDTLRPGQFLNSISGISYGEKVMMIPCFLNEAYFLFTPRVPGATGGLLARAIDGVHWSPPNGVFEVIVDKKGNKATWKTAETVAKSGLAEWGTSDPSDKNSSPAAVHALNCVTLLPEHMEDGPMVLSFVRSALKVGKKFAGNLRMSRVPSFGRVFELSSLKVEGPSGPYYEPRVKPAGFVGDVNVYAQAEEVYKLAKSVGVDVDIGSEAQEPAKEADPKANY